MSTPVRSGRVRALFASPRSRAWARAAVGAGILVAILLEVGAEPFLAGLAAVSVPAVAAALALGLVATVAASWRWRIVAGRLGLQLGWRQALPAYYRSQFLDAVLPGGVLGDVHRAVWHGRKVGELAHASRAVAAERAAGQAVQLILAVVMLVSLQLWAYAPAVGIVLLTVVAVAGLIVAAALVAGAFGTRARGAVRRELTHLRVAFGSVGAITRVTGASAVVVACHVATFLVACLAVGISASPQRLIGLGLVAVLAGAIPLSIGGWGPREAAVAWAFAATGLGAAAGIAASTAFGVLALIAVATGAAVLAASTVRRRTGSAAVAPPAGEEASAR